MGRTNPLTFLNEMTLKFFLNVFIKVVSNYLHNNKYSANILIRNESFLSVSRQAWCY